MGSKQRMSRHYRTWVEIDRRSLFFNLKKFKKLAGKSSVMALVKSNAYGHGLVLVAKGLLALRSFSEGGWFGVDSVTEALRLRREGIKNSILVLGYTLPARLAEAARNNITVTVSHFAALDNILRAKNRPHFHVKLDTGMHRQGFQEDDLPRLVRELQKARIAPEGVYSHLASAGDRQFSKNQIAAFTRAVGTLRSSGLEPKFVHIAATGGIMRYPLPFANIARLGLGLYGYLPDRRKGIVRPVLAWKTIVGEVKRIKKGECVGYDMTECLKRDSIIAILPIGYWHGFDRGLSRIGEVLIHGRRSRVLGRVSMDMAAIDVTNINSGISKSQFPRLRQGFGGQAISKVKVGDEVVLIGRQGSEFIGADEIGQKIGTTAYEVLTRINPLIFRIAI